jgi:transcription elongation GreA/GreB family factor
MKRAERDAGVGDRQLETDVAAGRISVASPLGRALVGLREGEIADVHAPRGRFSFEVTGVELPPASP